MTTRTWGEALAEATLRLTRADAVLDNVVSLLDDAATVTGASSAGLLAAGPGGALELVAATSHGTGELELYELQHDQGPCLEATRTRAVVAASSEDLTSRWADVGRAMLRAGIRSVQAFPVLWHDDAVGALNLFHHDDDGLTDERRQAGSAFANLAALALSRPAAVSTEVLQQRVLEALEHRLVVEQAKGVLAYVWDVDMPEAYRLLVRTAADQGLPLTAVAARIVQDAGPRSPQ